MTAAELIEQLSKLSPDTLILVSDEDRIFYRANVSSIFCVVPHTGIGGTFYEADADQDGQDAVMIEG